MIDLTTYRAILCLNGDIPFTPTTAKLFNLGLPIIAADGAANTLMLKGIKPSVVVGDFDSIHPSHLAELVSHFHYDQGLCDHQKSLMYLENNNTLPCIVLGIGGGTLDHVLNNINLFSNTNNIFYAPPIIGQMFSTGKKTLHLTPGCKVSFIGLPDAVISSHGLEWELTRYQSTFPGKNSCFNRAVKSTVELTIYSGTVLCMMYLDDDQLIV